MKNILIILNAVVYNRGSEALVRGLTSAIREKKQEYNITLVSSEENFDSKVNIEGINNYQRKIIYSTKSIRRYIVAILEKILKLKKLANKMRYREILQLSKKQEVILIIGADNYDITYGMQESLHIFNTLIRQSTNAKIILYDTSIDKRDITQTFKNDLKNFDYITVRESTSMQNLKEIVEESKLYYFPDPAFIMDKEPINLPDIFNQNKDVIGINISNLITNPRYGSQLELIINAYKNAIDYILESTSYSIILLPHVMNNEDLATLRLLYKDYRNNKRIELIEDETLNARQLKYIISKCSLYIGARTHSTIAAYSELIPTLVLGYSIKSKGIAIDLFKTDENYVLPVMNLKSEDYLVEGFKWLYKNKDKIEKKLRDTIPEYKEKAKQITRIIEQ